MCIFELWKYSNHRLWIGQVDGDIDPGGSTFFLLYLSRCASDNVAFCSKGLRHMVPNVRAETEKKHDWGFCCHVWIEVFEVHKEFEMRWWCLKIKSYVSGPIYTFLSRKHAVALSFSTWVVWLSPPRPLLLSDLISSNGAFGPSGSIRAWWVIHRSIWDCKIAESRWRINQANKILRFRQRSTRLRGSRQATETIRSGDFGCSEWMVKMRQSSQSTPTINST